MRETRYRLTLSNGEIREVTAATMKELENKIMQTVSESRALVLEWKEIEV